MDSGQQDSIDTTKYQSVAKRASETSPYSILELTKPQVICKYLDRIYTLVIGITVHCPNTVGLDHPTCVCKWIGNLLAGISVSSIFAGARDFSMDVKGLRTNTTSYTSRERAQTVNARRAFLGHGPLNNEDDLDGGISNKVAHEAFPARYDNKLHIGEFSKKVLTR
jgi:hypothetical protein